MKNILFDIYKNVNESTKEKHLLALKQIIAKYQRIDRVIANKKTVVEDISFDRIYMYYFQNELDFIHTTCSELVSKITNKNLLIHKNDESMQKYIEKAGKDYSLMRKYMRITEIIAKVASDIIGEIIDEQSNVEDMLGEDDITFACIHMAKIYQLLKLLIEELADIIEILNMYEIDELYSDDELVSKCRLSDITYEIVDGADNCISLIYGILDIDREFEERESYYPEDVFFGAINDYI